MRMKRVVALDCYGRDKNGINGLLRNIDTALIATLEIGLKRTSVIALLLYRPVLKKAITIEEVEQKFVHRCALHRSWEYNWWLPIGCGHTS